MAKRSRGSTRPGQRPASRRPGQRPEPTRPAVAPRPSSTLTEAEEARAAELEAEIVAKERAGAIERGRRERGRAEPVVRGREGSLLSARAAEEYTYVVRDVRRIGMVGGSLLLVMVVLFLLIEVGHVITY